VAFIRVNKVLGLSLEQGTENVPDDNKYYLLLHGETVRSFSSQKKAMEGFNRLREELGFAPPPPPDDLSPAEKVQQERVWMEYYRSEEYWGSASSFRSGGKLSNR
jgi:hypothetical protein